MLFIFPVFFLHNSHHWRLTQVFVNKTCICFSSSIQREGKAELKLLLIKISQKVSQTGQWHVHNKNKTAWVSLVSKLDSTDIIIQIDFYDRKNTNLKQTTVHIYIKCSFFTPVYLILWPVINFHFYTFTDCPLRPRRPYNLNMNRQINPLKSGTFSRPTLLQTYEYLRYLLRTKNVWSTYNLFG